VTKSLNGRRAKYFQENERMLEAGFQFTHGVLDEDVRIFPRK
jgi:hypothetical protein